MTHIASGWCTVIPETAARIFNSLSTAPVAISSLSSHVNLRAGVTVNKFEFKKLGSSESKEERKQKAEVAKNEKKQKAAESKKTNNAAAAEEEQHLFTKLDIRVGHIVRAWPHPESSKLYCEEIDVGEGAPREIASGLQQKIPLDQFQVCFRI